MRISAIMISERVRNNSWPDRPSRRDGLGRGLSVVSSWSFTDTITASRASRSESRGFGGLMLEHALCSATGQMIVLLTDISVVLPVRLRVWHVPELRLTKFADNHDPNRPSPTRAGVSILVGKTPRKLIYSDKLCRFEELQLRHPATLTKTGRSRISRANCPR